MTSVALESQTVTTEYNGWSNYETLVANLWLTNDESNYRLLTDAVNHPFMQDWERGEWLRDMLNYQLQDEIDVPCMWQDLLRHAFGQINWTEVIENNAENAR